MKESEKLHIDLTVVEKIIDSTGKGKEEIIPILQEIQKHFRYLPKEALQRVTELSDITAADITGVATFYTQFRHKPVGKHIISVCHGTACHVKGASQITDAIRRYLGLKEDEDTGSDGLFTVEKAACFGCCTLAPVVKIDDITYGHVSTQSVSDMIGLFLEKNSRPLTVDGRRKPEKTGEKKENRTEIKIGLGSCCVASGSKNVKDAFDEYIEKNGMDAVTKKVGCVGICHSNPFVELTEEKTDIKTGEKKKVSTFYAGVKPEDVKLICDKHLQAGSLLKKTLGSIKKGLALLTFDYYDFPGDMQELNLEEGPACSFLGPQKRIALQDFGEVDPLSLDEYRARGGFTALEKALKDMRPEEVIDEVKKAGLRGRGGAGFPTGQKWAVSRASVSNTGKKYIVCNGDEGDPGAFMDRMLLESYPYRILEGMALAAFAIGIDEGVLYIREEYPLALTHIKLALQECEKAGLLGSKILGTDFNLTLKVFRGAGAFICGEESALIASMEGKRGMPRFRPPFPSEKGFKGCPTNINNVETYAAVPWIIKNGGAAYSVIGTEKSTGTKVFALAGKVQRGGLIEVPMGITINEVVNGIGGGIAKGRQFKAVQIGGPSGGCIPASLGEMQIDFEKINETGAIMGSGGLVVLDDTDCMVEFARFFLEFTQDQSCGRCTFCRIGTKRMLELLNKFCAGEAEEKDIGILEGLAHDVKAGSLCGLGKTAPNPVLTTIKYFRGEYEAHTKKICPSKKCKALIEYSINDKCIGCTLCAQACPAEAIWPRPYEKHEVLQEKCIKCGSCVAACKSEAVDVESRESK